jgi:hypothetical protein
VEWDAPCASAKAECELRLTEDTRVAGGHRPPTDLLTTTQPAGAHWYPSSVRLSSSRPVTVMPGILRPPTDKGVRGRAKVLTSHCDHIQPGWNVGQVNRRRAQPRP